MKKTMMITQWIWVSVIATMIVMPLQIQAEESTLRVMSYNIHRGGTMHLKQPLSQTAKIIQEAKADVVGIQETRSPKGVNSKQLAQLLGWNYYVHPKNNVIITRYEIVEKMKTGIKVKLPSGQGAYIFNLHLKPSYYMPYQFLGIKPRWPKNDKPFVPVIKTEAEAIASLKENPGKQIAELLKKIRSLPDEEAPVFVVGDFNEPSHLDWTEATAKAGRHPLKVAYPTSKAFATAGFGDAYRMIYPDEMKNPGMTWSSKYKDDDPTSHPDRIDFVYFKGKGLKVNEVKVVGEDKEKADIVVTPYPSDHRAVVATFTLIDGEYPAPACDPFRLRAPPDSDPIKVSEGR